MGNVMGQSGGAGMPAAGAGPTGTGGAPVNAGMGGSTPVQPMGSGGAMQNGSGGVVTGSGGSIPQSGGAVGAGGATGTGGAASGGASGSPGGGAGGGSSGAAGAGGGTSGGTTLTGTLGTLGAVKPIVNSWVISNSGETLIYMSTAMLTCEMMQTMGTPWLSKVAMGAQVIEIVVKGAPTVKTYTVGPLQGEVNYAQGGRSSSYEVNATSGSITFTKAMAMGPVEGTVMATYASGNVMGTFHAEFCANASQY